MKQLYNILFLLFISSSFSINMANTILSELNNKGIQLEAIGLYDQALMTYFEGLARSPHFIEERIIQNLGISDEEASKKYLYDERRFNNIQKFIEDYKSGAVANKKVFICAEKGLGDTLQFIRYITRLPILPSRKFVMVPQPLYYLIKSMNLPCSLVDPEDTSLNYDYFIPLLALPYVTEKIYEGNALEHIPLAQGYIHPGEDSTLVSQTLNLPENTFKIGIIWQGDKNHINDKNRSVPLSLFYPLGDIQGIQLYSLQFGYGSEQLTFLSGNFPIIDLQEYLKTMHDTAAIIQNMDLIISIDSAAAHLAGAVGKDTIILIPYLPDFRWFMSGEETPWYSSVHLFRQNTPGDWGPVMQKIKNYIDKKLAEKVATA